MTDKTFAELFDAPAGSFVADMHNGLRPIAARFRIVHTIAWRVTAANDHVIGSPNWANKELRTLGEGTGAEPTIVCGYTYDAMTAGIVVLAERLS
jgi:hypothetical protein